MWQCDMFQKMLIQTQTYAIVTSVPSKNVFQIFAITILSKTTMLIYLIIHILIPKFFDFIELQVMVTAQTTSKLPKIIQWWSTLVHKLWTITVALTCTPMSFHIVCPWPPISDQNILGWKSKTAYNNRICCIWQTMRPSTLQGTDSHTCIYFKIWFLNPPIIHINSITSFNSSPSLSISTGLSAIL